MKEKKERKYNFTPKMRRGVEFEITHPGATAQEIAEGVGCSKSMVLKWHSEHPLYMQKLQEALKEEWKDARKIAQKQMIAKAKEGNMRALEYILNSNGYQAPTQVELTNKVIKVTVDEDE